MWTMILWLVAVAHAQSQSLPLQLEWQVPAECPPAAAVRSELERIARARPGHALEPVSARARVTRRGSSYQTTLHTERAGSRGERRLEANDCTTLLRTVTLVLALTFGAGVELDESSRFAPSAALRDAPASAAPSSHASPAASAPAISAPQPAPASATDASAGARRPAGGRGRERAWSYLLGAGARVGLFAPAAATLSLGAELARGALLLGARASGIFAPRQRVTAGIDARFMGGALALQACGTLPLGPISGALCGAGHAGILNGRSWGDARGVANAPWYALSGGLAVTWPRDFWLRLRAEAGLVVSLDRPRFVIEGVGQVQRVARLLPDVALLLVFVP
jgi:hypothetical protein